MSTRIYIPVSINVGIANLTFIRVDGEDYYPIYLLPMDAERGRGGFPTTPETVERDVYEIIGKDYTGGVSDDLIAMLNDEAKAVLNLNTNLQRFNVKGLEGKVPCLNQEQYTKLVLSCARNNDCRFCWDVLDLFFFAGTIERNDATLKAAKTWLYDTVDED
jgi:hypothetical protein